MGRATDPLELPGDDPHRPRVAGQCHRRNIARQDRLVTGRRHLVPARQIHPQLHHLELAARLAERRGMKFLVQDTGAGGHPLHVARTYHAALTGRIPVRHLPL